MVDIIAVLESHSIEQLSLSNAHQQYLLVEPGRKVEAQSITTHIGGGGLNTAVSLSRLGCRSVPFVKTGKGANRSHVIEHCELNKLELDGLMVAENGKTGSAVMIASHEKNAAIFTQRGANTMLDEGDLAGISLETFDLVHAAPLSGDSAAMLPAIGEKAADAGAFFSSNPGIRQISTRANSVLGAARHMSLISINEVEAAALVPCLSALDSALDWGVPKPGEPVLKSEGGPIPMRKFCETLHGHGPGHVLITAGADGAYLFNGEDFFHQEIVPAEVAGTAGAGDSFVSTLAWGLKSGFDADKALLLAAHNASSVVTHVNTTDGLLEKPDLLERAGLA